MPHRLGGRQMKRLRVLAIAFLLLPNSAGIAQIQSRLPVGFSAATLSQTETISDDVGVIRREIDVDRHDDDADDFEYFDLRDGWTACFSRPQLDRAQSGRFLVREVSFDRSNPSYVRVNIRNHSSISESQFLDIVAIKGNLAPDWARRCDQIHGRYTDISADSDDSIMLDIPESDFSFIRRGTRKEDASQQIAHGAVHTEPSGTAGKSPPNRSLGLPVCAQGFKLVGAQCVASTMRDPSPRCNSGYVSNGLLCVPVTGKNGAPLCAAGYRSNGLMCIPITGPNGGPKCNSGYKAVGLSCVPITRPDGLPTCNKGYERRGLMCVPVSGTNGAPRCNKGYHPAGLMCVPD